MKFLLPLFLVLSVACDRSDKNSPEPDQGEEAAADSAVAGDTVPTPENVAPAPEPETPGPESVTPVAEEVQPPAPTPQKYELDARSTTESAYFKLENGVLVKSSVDQAWQFAVKRTQFQTNSGTSGTLNVGVFDTQTTDYRSVTQCQADATFTYDAMLPASGAPGSLPYSGNAVLNAWYNYDGATHAVTSKGLVYLLSDDQTCYKFQILSYASGLYTVLADSWDK